MSEFGKFIERGRVNRGESQGDVARALDVTPAAIGKIERGETKYPQIWKRLVDHLGLDPVEAQRLLPLPTKAGRRPLVANTGLVPAQVAFYSGRLPPPRMIPILGHAAAGEPDRLIMMAEPIGGVPSIPAQGEAEGAYALYVYGRSMIPRYYPGELVFAHPRKPLTPDCFCVVQIGRGQPEGAFIKQYKSWAHGKLTLHQFNPDEPIEFDSADVFDVHRIVGSGDD